LFCKQIADTLIMFAEFYTIVQNRSGTDSVLDGKGFKYSNPPTKNKTGCSLWKCSKAKRGHCKASVQILGEYIMCHFGEHNHGPEKTPY
jgi:hypothetical protein